MLFTTTHERLLEKNRHFGKVLSVIGNLSWSALHLKIQLSITCQEAFQKRTTESEKMPVHQLISSLFLQSFKFILVNIKMLQEGKDLAEAAGNFAAENQPVQTNSKAPLSYTGFILKVFLRI